MPASVGLVLSGGGAWGAWQAGCLDRLVEKGLRFDAALGFSIGAVHGAFYACESWPRIPGLWAKVDSLRGLRPAPRLSPPSLFSDKPLRAILSPFDDDLAARAALRIPLSVLSVRRDDGRRVCARFTPRAETGWDAPLAGHVRASCAIPWIFPPARVPLQGQEALLMDGGVVTLESMSFRALSDCAAVLVLEMVRPEEPGLRVRNPIARREQRTRELVRRHMDDGVASLLSLQRPPRVLRLCPSQKLDFSVLGFRDANARPALSLGRADADSFLRTCDEALLHR